MAYKNKRKQKRHIKELRKRQKANNDKNNSA